MDHCNRLLASVCGHYCGDCAEYAEQRCRGCAYELGLTQHGECAIFQCCIVEHGLEHCGLCDQSLCPLFLESFGTDEVERRRAALQARCKQGTELWLIQVERKLSRK